MQTHDHVSIQQGLTISFLSQEHNRRLRYLQKQGVEDADEPKSKGSESKKAKKKEALAKRKETKKEEKRLVCMHTLFCRPNSKILLSD